MPFLRYSNKSLSVPGPQGPKGDPGLTTSVNGIQQVDGNVTLTGDNIPISVDDSTSITDAVDKAIETIDKAKGTILSNRTPTGGDNQSKGYETGDRWLAVPDKLAINLVPESWDKKESWTIEGSDADSVEFNELNRASGWGLGVFGVKPAGTRFISSPSAGTIMGGSAIRGAVLNGLAIDPLIVDHHYFMACTFRFGTSYLPSSTHIVSFSVVDDTGNAFFSIDKPTTVSASTQYTVSGLYAIGVVGDASIGNAYLQFKTSSVAATSAGLAAMFSSPILIDLTALYGSGNEPTQAQCEQLFLLPLSGPVQTDRERYFSAMMVEGRTQKFVCDYSDDGRASWKEVPILSNLYTGDITAQTGFSFAATGLPRYYRYGPFVYFEFEATVTTATTAGNIKNCFAGFPPASHAYKIPVTQVTAANAQTATVNAMLIYDPAVTPGYVALQSITAIAVNSVIRASGMYLALDRGIA